MYSLLQLELLEPPQPRRAGLLPGGGHHLPPTEGQERAEGYIGPVAWGQGALRHRRPLLLPRPLHDRGSHPGVPQAHLRQVIVSSLL